MKKVNNNLISNNDKSEWNKTFENMKSCMPVGTVHEFSDKQWRKKFKNFS